MEENKNKKKKIIIIVSVIAGVILIGLTVLGVIKLIEGGKKIAKEVDKFAENIEENKPVIDLGDKIDEIVSNVSDGEEETEKITEKITEEATEEFTEPETEAPTEPVTEAPTEAPTSPEYDYTFEEVIITIQPTTKAPLSEEEKLAQQFKWDKGSFGTDFYQEGNTSIFINRSKDDAVMQAKNAWIKENFGTSFTYNGYEFGWSETNQVYYWVYKYGNIHYMTSTSTSILGQYYRNFYSYRIADYLGFYGTDFVGYQNEASLNDEIFIWQDREEKMSVENPEANNVAYLKQLGWTEAVEDDGVDRMWEYESPEGVSAYVWDDGYIAIYVKYPEDEKENLCYFTIEEYNELVNNTNWTVHSQSGKFGWGDDPSDWKPFIKRYLVIE